MADISIDEVIGQLREARSMLEKIRSDLTGEQYEKVRREINAAISGCNRADKELEDLRPMEGQISMFDMLDEYERD